MTDEPKIIDIPLDLDSAEGINVFVNGIIGLVINVTNAAPEANHCAVFQVLAQAAIAQMAENDHLGCAKKALVSMILQYATPEDAGDFPPPPPPEMH